MDSTLAKDPSMDLMVFPETRSPLKRVELSITVATGGSSPQIAAIAAPQYCLGLVS